MDQEAAYRQSLIVFGGCCRHETCDLFISLALAAGVWMEYFIVQLIGLHMHETYDLPTLLANAARG